MTITITGDEIDAEQVIKFALENGAEIGDIDLSGSDISNVGALDTDSITSESVNTDQAFIGTEWSDKGSQGAAPYMTDGDVTIHVATDGDDSADGTQTSPVATPGEALSRIPKRNYRHDIRIYLDYGDYSGQNFRLIDHYSHPGGTSFQIVGHDSSNPYYDPGKSVSDVICGYRLISGTRGSEEIELLGIQFDTWGQHYDAAFRYRNCTYNGAGGPENNALGIKLCHAQLDNCTWEADSGSIDEAFNTNKSIVSIRDATVNGSLGNPPFRAQLASTVGLDNSDAVRTAGTGAPSILHSHVIGDSTTGEYPFINNSGRWVHPNETEFYESLLLRGNANVEIRDNDVEFEDSGGSRHTRFNNSGGVLYIQESALRFDEGMVPDRGETNLTATTGVQNNHIRVHDGSNSNPWGPYIWDDDNSQWEGMGPAQGTTISPS